MNCEQVEAEEVIERYLEKTLTEEERLAFEDHYFGCAACFDDLRMTRELKESGSAFVGNTSAASESRHSQLRYVAFSVLAMVIIAIGILVFHRSERPKPSQSALTQLPPQSGSVEPQQSLAVELARVDPLPYNPIYTRGNADHSEISFRKAMKYYVKRDYSTAASLLEAASKVTPDSTAVNLYLGTCYLMIHDPDSALRPLESAARSTLPDYSEQGHFYLAKAYLMKKDIKAAEVQLEAVIVLHGDRERAAEDMLRKLEGAPHVQNKP